MAEFRPAYLKAIARKSGYENTESDETGMIYRGIVRRESGSWGGWEIIDRVISQHRGNRTRIDEHLDIDSTLQAFVSSHYHNTTWLPLKMKRIVSQTVADIIFMFALEAGIDEAVLNLQIAINLLDRHGLWHPLVEEDGKMTTGVIDALNSRMATKGDRLMVTAIRSSYVAHQFGIIKTDPKGTNEVLCVLSMLFDR